MAHLLGLINQLRVHLGAAPYRLAPVDCPADAAGVARYASVRLEELAGFVRGLDLGDTDPGDMSAKALSALVVLGEGSAWLEVYRGLAAKGVEGGRESWREALAVLRQLDGALEKAMAIVVGEQVAARVQGLQTERRGASGRAGRRGTPPRRNLPCPCGSGKKYKHCCGKD
ncbi:MAG: SEC-C domain-containing protein [Acetobacteraceae bacterium]|nr:SEC-C domain-containing protein [Acetobacteraceae bacterium]